MVKTAKRLLTYTLVLSLVMGLLSVTGFAAEEDGAAGGADTGEAAYSPFVYQLLEDGVPGGTRAARWKFDLDHTGIFGSKHGVEYYWVYKNDQGEETRRIYYDASRGPISVGLFHVTRADGVTEDYPAYCVDFVESAIGSHRYRLLNLEESSYFSEEDAAHIRGIFKEGYWIDWEEDLADRLTAAEAAVNAWLEKSAPDAPEGSDGAGEAVPAETVTVSGLTRDQAITATQLAVWYYANYNNPDQYGTYYDVQPHSAGNTPEEIANICAFRDYLMAQAAEEPTADDLVFSDRYFVDSEAVFTQSTAGEAGVSYTVTLRVKLAANIEQGDALSLSAQLGERPADVYALTGEARLACDEEGYYTLPFEDVTQAEAAAGIRLTLSGTQALDGVYFFQAEPVNGSVRTASQNLVSKFTGQVPVHAERLIDNIVFGQTNLSLRKYDAETTLEAMENGGTDTAVQVDGVYHPALGGAVFDLYARKGQVDHLVKRGLTTDDGGWITVSGLPEGYEYYFKETKAPAGYALQDGQHWAGKDAVLVGDRYGLGDLKLSKTVDGLRTDQHFVFTVALDLDGADLDRAAQLLGTSFSAAWSGTEANICGGELHPQQVAFTRTGDTGPYTARVQLMGGESLTLSGLPVGTPYTVTEEQGDYTAESSGARGEIAAGETVAAFRNVKNSGGGGGGGGSTAAVWKLEAKKTLDGEPADGFAFELTDQQGKTKRAVSQDGCVTFPAVRYSRTGSYVYTVKEVKGEDPGIVYDESVYTVTVEIGRGGGDYVVEEVSIVRDGEAAEQVLFENSTVTEGTDPKKPSEEAPDGPEGEPPARGEDGEPQPGPAEGILAVVPATGDGMLVWLLAAGISALGLGCLRLAGKRRDRERGV